jgi:DNA modification methylase
MTYHKIICGDCLEILKQMEDNSTDMVFTDPPYGINKKGITNDKNLDQYYKSLIECYRVLKNNKYFITFASIKNLPLFFMNNPFSYKWQYIFYINNTMHRGMLGFNKYSPILIFEKGKAIHKPICDVLEIAGSSRSCAKRVHPTQKEIIIFTRIIENLSNKNDIILDPFLGSGTTQIACEQLERNSIGIEISNKYCNIAFQRLKKEVNQTKFGRGRKKSIIEKIGF